MLVDHRVAIPMSAAIFGGHVVVAYALFRQHESGAKRLRIAIRRHMLAHDVFAETRTFIDAEHTSNTARYRSHRAADGRTNRARRCTTCRCATFGTADDTLCIGCKRERRCKSRRSDQKFESHSHLLDCFASGHKTRLKRKRSGKGALEMLVF